jgi:hypothetical protein
MTKLKLGIFLAVVSLAALPVALAQAQTPDTEVTAVIGDDQALSDAITYTITNIPDPSAGTEYVGWLISDDGSIKLSTGPMTVDGGNIDHTFDSTSKRYSGFNLIHLFNKVAITEEAAGTDPDGPGGPVVFHHEIAPEAMVHIRNLLSSSPDGTEGGILNQLKGQLDIAIAHAALAGDADELDHIKGHVQHVINVIEGSGGPNYDASGGDPGDSMGILKHIQDSRDQAQMAVAAAPDDGAIAGAAALVEATSANTDDWVNRAVTESLRLQDHEEKRLARLVLASVAGLLNSSRNGLDENIDGMIASIAGEGATAQTYVGAQRMATYTLISGPFPVPPTPTPEATPIPTEIPSTPTPEPTPVIGLFPVVLPIVGDPWVAVVAKLALIAGLMLLISGGLVVARTRRSGSKA